MGWAEIILYVEACVSSDWAIKAAQTMWCKCMSQGGQVTRMLRNEGGCRAVCWEKRRRKLSYRCPEQWFVAPAKGWIAREQIVERRGMNVIAGLTLKVQWETEMKDKAGLEPGEEKNIGGRDGIEKRLTRQTWETAAPWTVFLKTNREELCSFLNGG